MQKLWPVMPGQPTTEATSQTDPYCIAQLRALTAAVRTMQWLSFDESSKLASSFGTVDEESQLYCRTARYGISWEDSSCRHTMRFRAGIFSLRPACGCNQEPNQNQGPYCGRLQQS